MSKLSDFVDVAGRFDRYDTKSVTTDSVIDLQQAQVFRISATTTARTVQFRQIPPNGKSMVIIVMVTGNKGVIWPTSVIWLNGRAPVLSQRNIFTLLFSEGVVYEVSRIIN